MVTRPSCRSMRTDPLAGPDVVATVPVACTVAPGTTVVGATRVGVVVAGAGIEEW